METVCCVLISTPVFICMREININSQQQEKIDKIVILGVNFLSFLQWDLTTLTFSEQLAREPLGR